MFNEYFLSKETHFISPGLHVLTYQEQRGRIVPIAERNLQSLKQMEGFVPCHNSGEMWLLGDVQYNMISPQSHRMGTAALIFVFKVGKKENSQ